MNELQYQQFRSQLKVFAQLGTCNTTNTRELESASGYESTEQTKPISIPHPLHSINAWKKCPEAPHHKYIKCPVGDFEHQQIPIALLAQERDNFITLKMQQHLKAIRSHLKNTEIAPEQKEKYELMMHMIRLNSRQKYVRDNLYASYDSFISGKQLKKEDLKRIFKLPKLTRGEINKNYVIRGISYNDYYWPKGAEFTPATPFTPLPRYAIRDRQKQNPSVDLKHTLPVVSSVLSMSASLVVVSHGFEFFSQMRNKFSQSRKIKQELSRRELDQICAQKNQQLAMLNSKFNSLKEFSDAEFIKFWDPPEFTHGIRIYPQPSSLHDCVMHEHQIQGMSWLIHHFEHHVNAFLADEVGLGKTLQVISFIAHLREQKRINGPHLIMVPGSVLSVWSDEFKKWLPTENVEIYIGKRKIRHNIFDNRIMKTNIDVLLTPYSIVEKDCDRLCRIPWRTIVFDEGHKLKNSKTHIFDNVDQKFYSDFRIVTTATPFQNQIDELWSLLYLVNPKSFSSVDIFNQFFDIISNEDVDDETHMNIVKRLQQIIRPYMLRRSKDDLDFNIPTKFEVTLKSSPGSLQNKIMNRAVELNITSQQKIIISRKVSNSPCLFLPRNIFSTIPELYILTRSPKIKLLDRILMKLNAVHHRFLIYSQWTSMMDLLSIYLKYRGITFLRIDGSVNMKQRMDIVHDFVTPGSQYNGMLLSTRSSAFGLNLQVADTVILYDSDYNPFVELQASARVHRIGQPNVVLVLRLMMNATGEEKILRMARKKFILGHQIIEAGKFTFNSSDNGGEIDKITSETRIVLDPTDQDIDLIITRSEEERSMMQFATTKDNNDVPELESYKELDNLILDTFETGLVECSIDEESDSDWEVC